MKIDLVQNHKRFIRLKVKNYSYSIDDSSEDKKAKRKKESFIKKNFNLKILESV